MTITPEQLSEFLKLNPDFFTAHGALLADIRVAHPHSNQAISLGERQVQVLRDKVQSLELKMREFIEFAEENDALADKLHKLSLGLMRARSLEAVFASLYMHLGEHFNIPHVQVRIWADEAPDLPECAAVSADIRVLMTGLVQAQCGHSAPDEVRAWFGAAGPHQQSFAMAPLRDDSFSGLLVLASEDRARFYPEMGTLYVTYVAELVAAAIARFL